MEDIKVEQSVYQPKITHIKNIITEFDKLALKYDGLLETFTVSECVNATSVRKLIEQEKITHATMIVFYEDIVAMLERLFESVNEVESNYSVNRLE